MSNTGAFTILIQGNLASCGNESIRICETSLSQRPMSTTRCLSIKRKRHILGLSLQKVEIIPNEIRIGFLDVYSQAHPVMIIG